MPDNDAWNVVHQRLRHAVRAASDRFPNGGDNDGLAEYRTLVLGSVAQLRQAGLAGLVAFYLSKREVHRNLLTDLFSWLQDAPTTRSITARREPPPRDVLSGDAVGPGLLGALLQRAEAEQATLALEAEAYFSQLRRVIEGFHQDRKARASEEVGIGVER